MKSEIQNVKSAERVLDILIMISEKGSRTLFEINKDINIPKSSLHFLLKTLVNKNFLNYSAETKKYELGENILSISLNFLKGVELRDVMDSYLKIISKETNETTHLSVMKGKLVIDTNFIESDSSIKVGRYYGNLPIHCTSTGKILITFMDKEKREQILKNYDFKDKEYTKNTITNINDFEKEIEKIKIEGIALDLGERDEYVNCIAAPIFGKDGQVYAAIGISGPSNRFTVDKMLSYKDKLIQYTKEISNKLIVFT